MSEWWIIPHTHWDREWYQTFQQFRGRLVKLIDHLLELLDHDPGFSHFMLDGQTIVLEDYLEIRPENRERLRRFISDGRVAIGPWYLLPDDLLVSGESLIRNLERGTALAQSFGHSMSIGYLPDQFGHTGSMPAILRGFGLEAACLWRGAGPEIDKSLFWWESADGSRVLVVYLIDSYSNAMSLPLEAEALRMRLDEAAGRLDAASPGGPLLFMNGSDHLEPQDGLPASLEALGKEDGVHIGSLEEYLDTAKSFTQDIPVWCGELRSPQRAHLLVGCTSVRHWIKQKDWELSNQLETYTEPLAAFAWINGSQYPHSFIDLAWKYHLQNQPHDSICGCSIDEVHQDMQYRYAQGLQIGQMVAGEAAEALAHCCDTRFAAGGNAVVVYNPGQGREEELASATVYGLPPQGAEMMDAGGNRYPIQAKAGDPTTVFEVLLAPWQVRMYMGMANDRKILHYYINGASLTRENAETYRIDLRLGHQPEGGFDFEAFRTANLPLLDESGIKKVRIRGTQPGKTVIFFNTGALPSLGLKAFAIVPPGDGQAARTDPTLRVTNRSIENAFYRVVISGDGSVAVTDKETRTTYRGVNRLVDGGDRGDEYNYDPPARDRIVAGPASPGWFDRRVSVRTEESGPVRATIVIEGVYRMPLSLADDRTKRSKETVPVQITRRVSLIEGVKRVEFKTSVDNLARDHRLRVHFPMPGRAEFSDAGLHFEVARRPVKLPKLQDPAEKPIGTHPQRSFVAVSSNRAGLAVSSHGLREYEVISSGGQTELALTLMRCVGRLSRPDLNMRPDNAGPENETPEAQCIGSWDFEYALYTYAGDWNKGGVQRFAEAYQSKPFSSTVAAGPGDLPPYLSLVDIRGANLQFSSLRRSRDEKGISLRLYDVSGQPGEAEVVFCKPVAQCRKVRLDEQEGETLPLSPDGLSTRVSVKANEIITLVLEFAE